MSEITDKHTIYLYSGAATKEQIKFSLEKAIDDCSKLLNEKINCNYYINVVSGADKILRGFSFIWVSDPRVYFLLTGYEANGNPREYEVDDMDWKPPERPYEEVFEEFLKSDTTGLTWFEVSELETQIDIMYTRPKKLIKKPPLVKLENYYIGPEQLALLERQEKKSKYIGREEGALLAKRAKVSKKPTEFVPNVLMCYNDMNLPVEKILKDLQQYTTEKLNVDYRRPRLYIIFETEYGSSFFLLLFRFYQIIHNGRKYTLKFENIRYANYRI